MKSDNNNFGYNSSNSLLEEADELVTGRNYTRDFALYIMYRQAIRAGDKAREAACMNLLQREVMKSLGGPVFSGANKKIDKSGETKSKSLPFE